jgi:hypothetical protein
VHPHFCLREVRPQSGGWQLQAQPVPLHRVVVAHGSFLLDAQGPHSGPIKLAHYVCHEHTGSERGVELSRERRFAAMRGHKHGILFLPADVSPWPSAHV